MYQWHYFRGLYKTVMFVVLNHNRQFVKARQMEANGDREFGDFGHNFIRKFKKTLTFPTTKLCCSRPRHTVSYKGTFPTGLRKQPIYHASNGLHGSPERKLFV